MWRDLLGSHGYSLAELVASQAGEDLTRSATRVWCALECVKKAGVRQDTAIVSARADRTSPYLVILDAGRAHISTIVAPLAGIADPVIDALVETAIAAKNRRALTIACRALDRVVRSGRYWVPMWYNDTHRLAYWEVFGRPAGYPATYPRYDRGDRAIPETWWYDPARAARI